MTDKPRRGHRRFKVLLILVVLLSAGWSAGWYYASEKAREVMAGWRAREAEAGRVYACVNENFGGFPFRIEVSCDKASAVFQALQPPMEVSSAGVLVAAQIYQPDLLIAEFESPMSIGQAGQTPSLVAKWSLGRSSLRGTPQTPERVSFSFDDASLERFSGGSQDALLQAKHIELHGRIAEGSVRDNPVVEAVIQAQGISAPVAHPAAVDPVDADVSATLRGLRDFSPKPWAARFREIQAAGGRIEVTKARLRQGDIVAVGAGSVAINADGRLEGQLRVTIAGLDQFLDRIGAQRMIENSPAVDKLAGALDRLSPGLGQAARQQASSNLSAGINMLGEQTTLEGKRAVTLPMRISDGVMFLGPIRIGDAPALF